MVTLNYYKIKLSLPGRLSELTMQVATEGPNRMSRAQSCHFWQSANAWVRNVSGKVWSAGLVPGTEIVEGKKNPLFPYFLKCKLPLKLLPNSIWIFSHKHLISMPNKSDANNLSSYYLYKVQVEYSQLLNILIFLEKS